MISQSYDTLADALYIEIGQRDVARTVQVDPGTLADLDSDGRLVGIEVIHPVRQWPLREILGRFHVPPATARELNAYFPMSVCTGLPPEPVDAGLRIAITC